MTTLASGEWGDVQEVRLSKDMCTQADMADDSHMGATAEGDTGVLCSVRGNARVIRIPRPVDVFRNRTEEYTADEELKGPAVGDEEL